MRKLCVVVLVFCFPLLAFGQLKTLASPTQFPSLLRSTLQAGEAAMGLIGLDPEKLQMTHSYSMSVFSGGEQSISQALYPQYSGLPIRCAIDGSAAMGPGSSALCHFFCIPGNGKRSIFFLCRIVLSTVTKHFDRIQGTAIALSLLSQLFAFLFLRMTLVRLRQIVQLHFSFDFGLLLKSKID
jgi:hypothetical protein